MRRKRVKRWTAVAIVMMVLGPGAASAQVYVRGQGEALAADVIKVGPEGVSINLGGAPKMVGWDRVREVRGEHGADAAKELAKVENLWRARARLERGDVAAAEPLLDALAARERGVVGPTPAVVFDGLLRCRLRRGAVAEAVWAWLDWIGARGGAIDGFTDPSSGWIGGRIEGTPVADHQTGLLTGLPPIFLRDAALDAAAVSDEWSAFRGRGPVSADMAMLYRAAMRSEAGLEPEIRSPTNPSESVRLVADIVLARAGSEAQRAAARASLKTRLDQKEIEPWLECWCRVGMGRSLVREADADLRRQGVIQLLNAPARFVRVSPRVASIALAEAAITLQELGDTQGALALKGELLDRFGQSAAAGWSRLHEIRSAPEPAKPPSEAKPGPTGIPSKDGATAPQGRGG